MNAPHGSRAVKVQSLTLPSFSTFGSFSNMLHAQRPVSGALGGEFYRDIRHLGLNPAGTSAVSICTAEPRQLVINVLECLHTRAWGIVPVDGDVFLQLAPASAGNVVPCDALTVFYVPRGTLCTLNPGVWHYAPYPVGDQPVHTLIVQPEPISEDENTIRALEPWQQVRIEV